MGVTYKLKDEVVHFIISQRQENPLFSCRQLAESASEKFGVHLSKSSVHDVLKESGIVTPRGRKPKDKFQIPKEKKKQIQESLSQVKLLPPPQEPLSLPVIVSEAKEKDLNEPTVTPALLPFVILSEAKDLNVPGKSTPENIVEKKFLETSENYEGAGKIFLKAARWDLGIYSEENIREIDRKYFLTYSKGVKVELESNKTFFIDLAVPLERAIREVADGLISNIKPFIADKISDEGLFKAMMEAQEGFKINKIVIVDEFNHDIFILSNIVERIRQFITKNRIFVDSRELNFLERAKTLFFSQPIDTNILRDEILNLNGFDTINEHEFVVNLLIENTNVNKDSLHEAADNLNNMFLYDDQDRLVKVKIQG